MIEYIVVGIMLSGIIIVGSALIYCALDIQPKSANHK